MALFYYKEKKNKGIRAAAYLRLSIEDGDKAESNSIGNQRELIQNFVAERPELHLVGEYADDGYTGTNFERPGFTQMIYNTVIVKDIEQRQTRREKESGKRKITDIALLKTIARYLASVIGSPVSMKSITDYLISAGRKISQNTVSDYVEALTESFVFYPVERFDIVGKQLLKVNNKFYMVDMGIRNHIFPRNRYDLGFTIENIVYLELSRRGGKVNIGKYGSTEVDFVTQKEGVLTYYQVTADMTAEETFEREMRPLRSIQDNYEKIVLTLDRFSLGNYDGIKVMNVIDWLLE